MLPLRLRWLLRTDSLSMTGAVGRVPRDKRSIVPDATQVWKAGKSIMRKRQERPAEYRERAAVAANLATEARLAHVREKHELAAATWLALAELDEQPSALAPTMLQR